MEVESKMAEIGPSKALDETSDLKPRILLHQMSSETSSDESGINSDMSDESPTSSSDDAVRALDRESAREENQQHVKEVARQLVVDVVFSMSRHDRSPPYRTNSKHSETLLRVVHNLSAKHKIVFEGIVRRLRVGVNGHRDIESCQRTFSRVVDELFADKTYNWGRIVTVFAFTGWLAQVCQTDSASGMTAEQWSSTVIDVASDYIVNKLCSWICQQGGWDAMDKYFAEPESLETKVWKGLLCAFVSLGCLATLTAVVR